MVPNRYANCLSICLAVDFSYVELYRLTSSITYSYHRTRFVLCDYSFDGLDGTFYIFWLYASYNKLIFGLDFINNRHVSSLLIQHLEIIY
jgi:hypothetical protein